VIIDGKKIAEEVLASLQTERAQFGTVTLGVVMSEGDAATESFVKIKTRVALKLGVEIRRFRADEFSQALECDGVIIQMPIAGADELIANLPPEKDVDALGPNAKVRAPVAEAVSEIFSRANVSAAGKKAIVVGAGKLVGMPVAQLLRDLGAHVSVITQTQGSLEELVDADIVVLGAGEPGLVKPDMLKQGVVLIDAGTSEAGGRLAGDADPLCAEVASVFTPVPGGVGPIAVAMIFKNLFTLAHINKKTSD
jgi:methylenetetrahydrofolate dehydrogenase (NADP+)/methenyltetrahydrofolate cyclohydrolase